MSPKQIRKEDVVRILASKSEELKQFHVKSLALFGSVARDEGRSDSDLDFLVEFSQPVGLFHFVRFQRFLEGLFSRKVDVVAEDALRPEFREQVKREKIRAA